MADAFETIGDIMRGSQILRLLTVGALTLVLQIPIVSISHLVSERRERRQEAFDEVAAKWGNAQAITGPVLVLPYQHRWTEVRESGAEVSGIQQRTAFLLPQNLRIRGQIDSSERRRGIFSIPVYALGLEMSGSFAAPDFGALGIDPQAVEWDRARVAIGVSDVSAINARTAIIWGGRAVDCLPGTGGFADAPNGIHAAVPTGAGAFPIDFTLPLSVNGSVAVNLTPAGENTVAELRSNSPHPKFEGGWLPAKHSVTGDGFTAEWSIPFLGRGFPQAWTSETQHQVAIDASRFGVALIDPVDHYRMAERSVKYAALFILLTFAVMWLLEVVAGAKIHPIQYLLLGAALCLFYLLELALSEHLGFPVAYSLASLAVIGMVAGYGKAILRRTSRAALVAAGVSALYAYLYVLLTNEDYALLIGAIGLFAILAAIMFVTRQVDWFAVGTRSAAPRAAE